MKLPTNVILICGLFATMGPAMSAQSFPSHKTGSPFCANYETSRASETLPDGTQTFQPAGKTRWCRDSAGRTRVEFFLNGRPLNAEIFDTVGGVSYVLDSVQRTASRTVIPPALPLSPPNASASPQSTPGNPTLKREQLGSQVIEGVLTEGTRTRFDRFPSDQANAFRDTLVLEEWFSPELGELILRKKSDDINGLFLVYRLTDIDRSEPDPSLFRVPANYTVVQAIPSR